MASHIMDARMMNSMRGSSSSAATSGASLSGTSGADAAGSGASFSRPVRIASRRKASISSGSTAASSASAASPGGFSASSLLSRTLSARRPSLSRSSSASTNTHAAAAAAATAASAPSSASHAAKAAASSSSSLSSSAKAAAERSKKLQTPDLIDLKTISAEEVEWEGYLYKQRKIVKNWTPRYITLQNRTITVYKSKVQALGKEQHRGKWVIKQILSSLPSAGFGGSRLQPDVLGFSFLATNGNLIHLVATSAIGKAMWMHMMQLSLHRASAEPSPLLQMSKPRELFKARSTDDILSLEASLSRHFADKFYADLLQLLAAAKPEHAAERLPGFLRQLSKDVELLFDLESAETNQPSCVFKGIYHGREGLVHFCALYASKYLLVTDVTEEPAHRADDDEHHSYAWTQPKLVNTVSGSTTAGKLALQLTFTPARRVCRIVLSFRQQRSASTATASAAARRVTSNPMVLAEHASCFHQCHLSKRSLALSFSDFDVVGVLGQGGFGTVVLVKRHLSQDEYFAIKIIDKHSGAESALKERRILSGVRHPFMACLRFAFQTPTKLYLGLDYYKGGNLYLHMHSSATDPNISTSSGRRFSMYKKIQTADVKYDRYPPLDPLAVDLLQQLLVRDPAQRIGIDAVRAHPFFADINWLKLEVKDVDAPFIPPSEELMQNVHEHFRNMKVDESIGELKNVNGGGRKATTVVSSTDESHFDEFSFAFDTSRATFNSVSMADDGWLMRQLQEGAAMRGRINSSSVGADDDIIEDPAPDDGAGSEDDAAAAALRSSLFAHDSHSSEEVLSDEGDTVTAVFSMDAPDATA
ncbi:hypothetical protein PybrP1_001075 [[Pythium] brassicae (nom. inval.)]|nr:hypothetical protein PybrP1_001075 [[Pythium] brassicae (nom. inval.)]